MKTIEATINRFGKVVEIYLRGWMNGRWREMWPRCFRQFIRPDNTDTSNYVEHLFRDVCIVFS